MVEAATRFRHAIEVGGLSTAFDDFPQACGDTCDLLTDYLALRGMGGWALIVGWSTNLSEDEDGCGHAWLQQNGLIVDITADQFKGRMAVTVTVDKTWYQGFEVLGQSRFAGLNYFTGGNWAELQRNYYILQKRADIDLS